MIHSNARYFHLWVACVVGAISLSSTAVAGDEIGQSIVVLEGRWIKDQCDKTFAAKGKSATMGAVDVTFQGKVATWMGQPVAKASVMIYEGSPTADYNVFYGDRPSATVPVGDDGVFRVSLHLDSKQKGFGLQRLEISAPGFRRALGPVVAGGDYCVSAMMASGPEWGRPKGR